MALLGFYGGTFDPIHQGHLQSALFVVEQCQLSALQLIPCHLPPHRTTPGVHSQHRAAMVELAIAPYPQLALNRIELDKNSPSYTVETLELLQQQYPNDQLLFVIGMDSLLSFPNWHRPNDILQLCHLIVLQRPGYPQPNLQQQPFWQHRLVDSLATLRLFQSGKVLILDNPQLDIAASDIRQCWHDPMQAATDKRQIPAVTTYIQQHGLYQV